MSKKPWCVTCGYTNLNCRCNDPLPKEEVEALQSSPLQKQVGGGHYKGKKIQPVEYIHANSLNFFEGNVVKYITRWRDKGGVEDLDKVIHYTQLLKELEDKS
jgi:hypothetical protein